MATFTIQLKEVIESLYGTTMDEDDYEQQYESVTFNNVTYGKLPVLPQYNDIGLGFYPLFDEGYRKILNGKIIDEYYNQEIGTETVENFVLILRKKMDQIMPYYNQLYASEMLSFDPLSTMDIRSVGTSTMEGTESNEAENTTESETYAKSRAVNSNFPQTTLAGNADYATSAADSSSSSDVNSTSNQTSDSTSNTESTSDSHVTGYQAVPASLLMAFRETFLNIDTLILADLMDCFMLLNNSGDEYFAPESRYGWY